MLLANVASADVISFSDIQYWVGTGSNQAAMVIDWNDGKDAWAWGYRWDGAATGADMIEALVRTDPRLYSKLWDFGGGLGHALIGFGLDRDLDGFAIDPATDFGPDGYLLDGRDETDSDGGMAIDPDDSYGEGWWEGYWSYWVPTTPGENPYDGGSWGYSGWGASSRQLTDGDWDGWSFLPGFFGDEPGPAQAAPSLEAVPEPSSLVLASIAGIGCLVRHRRNRRAKSHPPANS